MKLHALFLLLVLFAATPLRAADHEGHPSETAAGWVKGHDNPVLGGAKLGTCFDVALLKEDGKFRMWFSWRPRHSIGYAESADGLRWSDPKSVLVPDGRYAWESGDLNRPAIIRKDGVYHLWFTAQADGKSVISYATSTDGIQFTRAVEKPVLVPELPWEKVAVMCPHVEWDAAARVFRMWYSGGEQYEPNAIGYATSPDGIAWTKLASNPIFDRDRSNKWESHKVTACQVVQRGDWWYMFYIGFESEEVARIGVARSKDGITGWERHKDNPIISPGRNSWDDIGVYKPFAIYDADEKLWRLWYNGRNHEYERIGIATHPGEDLGFESK